MGLVLDEKALFSARNSHSRPQRCKAESKSILRAEGLSGSLFSSAGCGEEVAVSAKGCTSCSLPSIPCPLTALPH